jgi:hypothetical protein
VLEGKLVEINIVRKLETEEILFNGFEWPVLLFHAKSGLKLFNGGIDWDSKRYVGAYYRSHQPFGIFLEIFSKANGICF